MPPRLGLLVVVVLGATILWLAWTWNRLVALRAAMRAAWASVDALLKRRTDLIPNLVAVVKGAMDFEAGTLERVVTARSQALGATAPGERAAAESQLAGTVRQLFAVVERYPELKANTQILSLQRELAETESDIASARRYYNAVVRDLNIMRESFPNVLVANALGFAAGEYFELDDGDRAVPSTALEREP
jgi:LemA protein